MKTLAIPFLLGALGRPRQPPADKADQVDEALKLAGVRPLLEALPARAGDMAVAVLATFPADKRKPLEPAVKVAANRILEPNGCYPLVRRYFLQNFDAAKMR